MRRLLYLAALSMVVGLVFAPVALAQERQELDPVAQLGEPGSYTDPTAAICARFASQEEAQQYFETNATPEEQAIMDPNGDGLGCTGGDLFTPAGGGVVTPDQTVVTPDQGVQKTLPDTGGTSLLLPAAGLLLVTGLIGMRLVRRS